MKKLVLRNDRLDNATWLFTAGGMALAGLGALVGLIVMNVRDPKALWMGPKVLYPQTIYIVFDVVVLLLTLAMAGLAIYRGKKAFNRRAQLVIDTKGIHDRRARGRKIAWSEVAEISSSLLSEGGIATLAQLKIVTNYGETVAIDVLGLDKDLPTIVSAVKKIRKAAAGDRLPDTPPNDSGS
jgi:hypothetical protein